MKIREVAGIPSDKLEVIRFTVRRGHPALKCKCLVCRKTVYIDWEKRLIMKGCPCAEKLFAAQDFDEYLRR